MALYLSSHLQVFTTLYKEVDIEQALTGLRKATFYEQPREEIDDRHLRSRLWNVLGIRTTALNQRVSAWSTWHCTRKGVSDDETDRKAAFC
jgi:hypothetical protein